MKIYLLVLLVLLQFTARAQQIPTITQFWNAKTYYNPANSSTLERDEIIVVGRNQWNKLNYSPKTILATYANSLDKIHCGFGISANYETIGYAKFGTVKASYSYKLKLNDKNTLHFGAAAGVSFLDYDLDDKIFYVYEKLPKGGANFTSDFGMIYNRNKFYFGASVLQLTGLRIGDSYQEQPHLILHAERKFKVGENSSFTPYFVYKNDFAFQSIDLLLNAQIHFVQFGVGFQNRDSFSAFAGVELKKQFRLNYSYQMTVSKLNNVKSGGSHELGLGYRFKSH